MHMTWAAPATMHARVAAVRELILEAASDGQRRYDLQTLGPNVGIIYILGSP